MGLFSYSTCLSTTGRKGNLPSTIRGRDRQWTILDTTLEPAAETIMKAQEEINSPPKVAIGKPSIEMLTPAISMYVPLAAYMANVRCICRHGSTTFWWHITD